MIARGKEWSSTVSAIFIQVTDDLSISFDLQVFDTLNIQAHTDHDSNYATTATWQTGMKDTID